MSFKRSRQARSFSPSASSKLSTHSNSSCSSTLSQAAAAPATTATKAAKCKTAKRVCNYPALSKSVVNLFKLVAIVAFIKYELISQQLVSCKPREGGLIYNKDGKFIYRAPKSRDGFIIVIDDRQRDSLMNSGGGGGGGGISSTGDAIASGHASIGSRQLMLDIPRIGAESYPQMQIINPRNPHEQAPSAAASYQMMSSRAAAEAGGGGGGEVADFYPGGQIHFVSLADLQAGMGHPHQLVDPHQQQLAAAASTGAGAGNAKMARSRNHQLVGAANAIVPAGLPPGSLQVVPLIQLYQPPPAMHSRLSADGFGGFGGGGGGNPMLPAEHGASSVGVTPAAFYHQSHQRVFGAEHSPIVTYGHPATPMDMVQSIELPYGGAGVGGSGGGSGGGGSGSEVSDLPSAGARMVAKGFGETNSVQAAAGAQAGRFNLVDYGHALDAHGSRVEFQADQGNDEMMPSTRNDKLQSPNSLADLIPFSSSPNKQQRDESRPKGGDADASVKQAKNSKLPSAKPKASEPRHLSDVLTSLHQDELDPVSNLRNSSYWRQFKDQYSIMNQMR